MLFFSDMAWKAIWSLERELEAVKSKIRAGHRRRSVIIKRQSASDVRRGLTPKAYAILLKVLRTGPVSTECAWACERSGQRGRQRTSPDDIWLRGLLDGGRATVGAMVYGSGAATAASIRSEAQRWIREHALYMWMEKTNRDLGMAPSSSRLVLKNEELKVWFGHVRAHDALTHIEHPLQGKYRTWAKRWRSRWAAVYGKLRPGAHMTVGEAR